MTLNQKQIKKYNSWFESSEKDYTSWIKVYELSSRGLSSIIHGFSTSRNHHLLSNHELAIFLLLDWNHNVLDIKEQYALDPNVTSKIAIEAKIKHPVFEGDLHIMSTDFLVCMKNGSNPRIAFQVKPSELLSNKRVIEKLEIERRYWARKNIPWYLITEKEIPQVLTENVRWLQSTLCNISKISNLEEKLDLFLQFSEKVNLSDSIIDFTKQLDLAYDFEIGESLLEVRQLIAWRYIQVDLTKKFNLLTVKDLVEGTNSNSELLYESPH